MKRRQRAGAMVIWWLIFRDRMMTPGFMCCSGREMTANGAAAA